MTLVGKIFTVLILIMSVAFMMLAVTVFATHRNWREVVLRPRDDPKGPGLKIQCEDLTKMKRELEDELARAGDRLALEISLHCLCSAKAARATGCGGFSIWPA